MKPSKFDTLWQTELVAILKAKQRAEDIVQEVLRKAEEKFKARITKESNERLEIS